MQVLNVTNLPIYLPYDKAPEPFGDPIEGVTATAATPGIVTVPGYDAPVAGDAVAFSFLAGGSIAAPLVVGTTYYVVAPIVNNTFAVSATKGGSAITTTTTGASLVAHLISNQTDGTPLGIFKPNNSPVCVNLTAGTLVLQGAPDLNTAAGFGAPSGPGTWVQIASLPTLSMQPVTIGYDWIRVSTAGTLQLLQN